jgi:hypothetical protein
MKNFATALTTFICAAFWANAASAACYLSGWICLPFPIGGGGSGGGVTPSPAPEIDISSAFAALVLLITVGAIVYHRWQRR